MPVPPKRHSKGQTRRRRAHHFLTATTTSKCLKCGAMVRPHYACPSCGFYRGRDVMKKSAQVERKLAKTSPKKAAAPKAKKATKKAAPKASASKE